MDINLGNGMDGTEAARRILDKKNIPIIFLSSHTESDVVEKTEKITSYGYVVKNSGITVLDASIKMAFKLFKANRHIENQRQHLDTILLSMGDALISTDINGKIVLMNPVSQKLTGWKMEDAKGKNISEVFNIVNVKSKKKVENPIEKVLFTGKIEGLANHTMLISKDGMEYQIADSASPIKDKKGDIRGVVMVFRDVTEDYFIRENLMLSEEKFRIAFHTSPDSVNINTMSGRYVDINSGFTLLTGYTREDVIGVLSTEIDIWAIPEDREKLIKELKEKGFVRNLESSFRCKDGSFKIALMSAQIIKLDGIPHILSITRDISDRKKIEEEFKKQSLRLFYILEGSDIGTWEWNIETGETIFNEKWASMLGYSLNELKPTTIKTWESLTHPDDLKETYKALEKHFNGDTDYYNVELRMKHKNGTWVWILDRGKLISRTIDGKPLSMYGSHIEISKRKKMEIKLNESLEDIKMLFSELQHRVKNSFNLISSIIDLMRFDSESELLDSAFEDLGYRVRAISEMYTVLYQSNSVKDIDMDIYLHKLVQSIPVNPGTLVKCDLASFKMPAKDAATIGLIANELITNSIKHAFPIVNNSLISVKLLKKKKNIFFEISDNGIGISKDINPATAKSMGMTLVYNLVQQLNGNVDISNKKGTCFSITFPLEKISKQE